jgi:hypothetical protein
MYKDIRNKGIKNVAQNMLALPPEHNTVYDGSNAGSLIIIPIVDLDQSVDHLKKNQFFDLLVVGRSKSVYNWIYNGSVAGTANVFSESLDATVTDATEEDIRIATNFLNYYTKAAAFIALTDVKEKLENDTAFFQRMYERMDPVASEGSSRKSQSSAGRRQDFEKRITNISSALKKIESESESGGLCVPIGRQGFDFKNQKVLKVKLKKYFDDIGLDLELYPSWGPLGMKATANWLVFAGQPLIPACMDPVTVPVTSIEINSSDSPSDISADESDRASDSIADESDNSSVGAISHAVCSPRETRLDDAPTTVTP